MINIAQIRSTDWVQHIRKILRVGAVLTFLGLLVPACFSDLGPLSDTYMWFFGFWFSTSEYLSPKAGFPSDFYVDPVDEKLMIGGGVATALLIIALIVMSISSSYARNEKDNKIAAGTGFLGGILAIIGPAFYYFYLDAEIVEMGVSVHWFFFDPSFGFYLPIIGGILAIIGAIAAGYAFTLESKREPVEITTYKPTSDKLVMDKEPEITSQQERPIFCKKCGTKLVGDFCQECGAKAEF